MKILTMSTIAIALPLLSACVVEQPPRRGYAPRPVVVQVDHYDDRDDWDDRGRGRGYHCPPGQAKKGNC